MPTNNKMKLEAERATRLREDGRRVLLRMPMSPEVRDYLPTPMGHMGLRKWWVGTGWVTEGPADGTEPLLFEGNNVSD